MKISCKETQFTYNIYHIVKAFFPDAEIEQCVDAEQESLVILEMDGGSCFSVAGGRLGAFWLTCLFLGQTKRRKGCRPP